MRNSVGADEFLSYGILPSTAERHADGRATREAIKLASLAHGVWPHHDERLINIVSELIVDQTIAFAIAGRRALEVEGSDCNVPDLQRRLGFRINTCIHTGSLKAALGTIIHSNHILVVTCTASTEEYATGDRRIALLHVKSDRNEMHVCPFGLAQAYLRRPNLPHQPV